MSNESTTKTKVPAELEFDHPAFLELYEMIAKMKGVSLGRIAAWGLQSLSQSVMDELPDDMLRKWFEARLGKENAEKFVRCYW
jgi:hypothetical protein